MSLTQIKRNILRHLRANEHAQRNHFLLETLERQRASTLPLADENATQLSDLMELMTVHSDMDSP